MKRKHSWLNQALCRGSCQWQRISAQEVVPLVTFGSRQAQIREIHQNFLPVSHQLCYQIHRTKMKSVLLKKAKTRWQGNSQSKYHHPSFNQINGVQFQIQEVWICWSGKIHFLWLIFQVKYGVSGVRHRGLELLKQHLLVSMHTPSPKNITC